MLLLLYLEIIPNSAAESTMELSGRFCVVIMSCGCDFRALEIRLIKAP
jgi:hypothetical protein